MEGNLAHVKQLRIKGHVPIFRVIAACSFSGAVVNKRPVHNVESPIHYSDNQYPDTVLIHSHLSAA